MIELSRRLRTIAAEVPAGSRVADIGSDHALLPVFLAEQGQIEFGVAGEVNDGPFAAAAKQIRDAGLESMLQARLGDGLAVIEPGEVDVVTIAGMGGSLMTRILTEGEAKLSGVKRLLLQPNVGEDTVRRWFTAHNWLLIKEQILLEDEKIYEVLTAERADADLAGAQNQSLYAERKVCGVSLDTDWIYAIGPYLLEQGGPVLLRKWQEELGKRRMIVRQLEQSTLTSAREKREAMLADIRVIEEVLACWQTDKPSSR
jgi:tRNA (adenine22-N1)-methyltransferase